MTRYVIFGTGRVGPNMAVYLQSLGHEVRLVSRVEAEENRTACIRFLKDADIVAAAIPDDKLLSWRDEWRPEIGDQKIAIHFSGAASIEGVFGFHPLYSFPNAILPSGRMKEIAFACEPSAPSFAQVFPGAANAYFTVEAKDRARYHALAVLSGNLAAFIWNEAAKDFAALSGMPAEKVMGGYLTGVVDRFVENPADSMTGPVVRQDRTTVMKNLAGLEGAPKLKTLYEAFIKTAWPDFDTSKDE